MTVDLDVLVRSQLLDFLKQECKTRNATVLYATHIYDGLDKFPTKVCHIQLGSTTTKSPIPWPLPPKPSFLNDIEVKKAVPEGVLEKMEDPERAGSRLLELAVAWLREDRKMRLELEKSNTEGFRSRGARTTEETRDSETFYRKWVCVLEMSEFPQTKANARTFHLAGMTIPPKEQYTLEKSIKIEELSTALRPFNNT